MLKPFVEVKNVFLLRFLVHGVLTRAYSLRELCPTKKSPALEGRTSYIVQSFGGIIQDW